MRFTSLCVPLHLYIRTYGMHLRELKKLIWKLKEDGWSGQHNNNFWTIVIKQKLKPVFKFLPIILSLMLFLNLSKIAVGHSENYIISQCLNKYSLLIENIQTNLKCSETNVAGINKS